LRQIFISRRLAVFYVFRDRPSSLIRPVISQFQIRRSLPFNKMSSSVSMILRNIWMLARDTYIYCGLKTW
jgi:hypothetical protein